MGATEKRRESGADVVVIGGIGGSRMGGAERYGSLSGLESDRSLGSDPTKP
jgi:hypothetical protein